MIRDETRLNFSLLPLLALGLILGGGFLGQQIWSRINQDVFNHPRGDVTGKTPGSLGLDFQKVQFRSDNDINLKGWYISRKDVSEKDCIILAPGKTENRWDTLKYAPFLAKSGFNVLLFDPRSTGLSGGNRYGFGYFESRDLEHAMDFLVKNKGVEDIGLFGRSAGATSVLLAAARDDRVDAVVADSPYANLKLASKDFGDYSTDPTLQFFFPLYMFATRISLGVDIYGKTNILAKIKEVKKPVFFIHGLDDAAVGYQNSEMLYERKNQPKRLWLIPQTDHVQGFNNKPEEYSRKVVEFFHKYL